MSSTILPLLPAEDEWFGLEVDYSIVTTAGFNHQGLDYVGPEFSGKKVYRTKLIRLGYVENLIVAKIAARAENPKFRLLEGQALEPFRMKFHTLSD